MTRNPQKRFLFIVCTAVLVVIVCEVGARVLSVTLSGSSSRKNPYVDFVNQVPAFQLFNSQGQQMFRRSQFHSPIQSGQQFLHPKPAGGLRIFCLGGSAAKGWPYDAQYTYPSFLLRKLQQLQPNRHIEVINVAGWSYASYRTKFIFDEIMDYDPDVVLIFTGNNEFLEDLVYRPMYLSKPWSYSALATIVHDAWRNLSLQPLNDIDVEHFGAADQIATRLSWAFNKASRSRKNTEQFKTLQDHYRYNVESMVAECKKRDIEVMLLTVPVNLKDWIPNVSMNRADITPEAFTEWQSCFRQGMVAYENGNYLEAVDALNNATKIDSVHAETHYFLGESYHRLGDIQAAKREYLAALQQDAYPFRSLPQFDAILRDISEKTDTPLVDIIRVLEDRTPDGIIGMDALIDYVHPSVASNEAIAHAILSRFLDERIIPEFTSAQIAKTRPKTPPHAELDLKATYALYVQFLVMRQYDKLDQIAARLEEWRLKSISEGLISEEMSEKWLAGTRRVQEVIVPYRKLLRAEKLGIVNKEFSDDEAKKIFARYLDLIHDMEAGRLMTREQLERFVLEDR